MRDERLKSIESKARSLPVEENLRRWEEMKAGTAFVRLAQLLCAAPPMPPEDPPSIASLRVPPRAHTGQVVLPARQDRHEVQERRHAGSRHVPLQRRAAQPDQVRAHCVKDPTCTPPQGL